MISREQVLNAAENNILTIKARPNAPKTEITSIEDNIVKISINAPPENDKANKELVKFLSKLLKLQVTLIAG